MLLPLSGVVLACASGIYAAECAESDRQHVIALGLFLLGAIATVVGIVNAFSG